MKPINLIFPHLPEENIISVYIKSNYVKVYTHRGENVTPREFVFTKNINLSKKKKECWIKLASNGNYGMNNY